MVELETYALLVMGSSPIISNRSDESLGVFLS